MRESMRVVSLKGGFGLDRLTLEERAIPECGPGEIVMRVRAVSLNYRDLLMVTGKYAPSEQGTTGSASFGAYLPVTIKRSR